MQGQSFYDWLCLQNRRQDTVGILAREASSDVLFPRHARRLYVLLLYYKNIPEIQAIVKTAHREWRKAR